MKEFEVQLIVKEYYKTYVFAEDEDQAYEFAMEKLNKGELEVDHHGLAHEVEATGYEED